MQAQEAIPVHLARRPALDLVQVLGAVGELIRAPAEQVDVLRGAQVEQLGRDLIDAEDDDAMAAALDLGAEFLLDFFLGDGFQARA